jgi:hypothetical protein
MADSHVEMTAAIESQSLLGGLSPPTYDMGGDHVTFISLISD